MGAAGGVSWIIDARNIFDVLAALGLPGALLWWIRDRRKALNNHRIDAATIDSAVSVKDTEALEAQMTFMQKAFSAERESLQRQIVDLTNEVHALRGQVTALQRQLDRLISPKPTRGKPSPQ